MFIVAFMGWAAVAQAACEIESHSVNVEKPSSGRSASVSTAVWDVRVGTGAIPCRHFVLDSQPGTTIKKIKAVIRQPDDSRSVLGMDRLVLGQNGTIAGQPLIELPELRNRDRLKLMVTRETVSGVAVLPMRIPGEDAIIRRDIHLEFLIPKSGAKTLGPDGTVRLKRTHRQTGRVGTVSENGGWFFAFPPARVDENCTARVAEKTIVGTIGVAGCEIAQSSEMEGQTVVLDWGWTLPHAPGAGTIDLQQDRPVDHATVRISNLPVQMGGGSGLRQTADAFGADMIPARPREDVQMSPDFVLTWRVKNNGKNEVLPSRKALLKQVEDGALAASMPEPGLGLGLKGRKGDVTAVPELLAKVRTQVVRGTLSNNHPLKPRKLMAARKSRWATPWEQALLLTRYLGQLKIVAQPIPVRPRFLGRIDSAVPEGYTEAVVRVQIAGKVQWIDPSCPVCAVGELPAALWGGQALSRGIEALPDNGPVAEWSRTVNLVDKGAATIIELSPSEALALRLSLARVPLEERFNALPALVGHPLDSLIAHQGVTDRGGAIRLELSNDGTYSPRSFPDVAIAGSQRVDMGAASRWTDTLIVDMDEPRWREVTDEQRAVGPFQWRRTVSVEGAKRIIVESTEWPKALMSRADAVAFFAAVTAVR